MTDRGNTRLRMSIAAEAARLMYEEDVKQYFTAKRIAARRLCGRVGGKRLRYRPADLPSNGEIRDALLVLADLAEGERRRMRLFAMRVTALEAMKALLPFEPRLIGSVSTGHVRRGSDIDLHVFTDDEDKLFAHLEGLGWVHEVERVSISKFGQIRDYTHVHVADVFAVELTVYERRELWMRPRSSTDGKPIDRISVKRLEAMLAEQHADSWASYCEDGTVDGMAEALSAEDDDAPRPGPFDGLLEGEPDEPPEDALPWGDEGEEEDYEPLPGFEAFSRGHAGGAEQGQSGLDQGKSPGEGQGQSQGDEDDRDDEDWDEGDGDWDEDDGDDAYDGGDGGDEG